MINPVELATKPLDVNITKLMQNALTERYSKFLTEAEHIELQPSIGENSAYFRIEVGNRTQAHVFEFLINSCEMPEDGCWDLLDFADGVLAEFFENDRDAWLELDFAERNFEDRTILVRHNLVKSALEHAGSALLAEKTAK